MWHQTGLLLLYHRPVFGKDATTVREHISSFSQHSQFAVIPINTALGFPSWLSRIEFDGILLHYSLFGSGHYPMDRTFVDYLDQNTTSFKIAFFQDEYYFCPKRFAFIKEHGIDCIFTLLEERYHDIYRERTGVESIHTTLTGYVGAKLIAMGQRYARSESARTVDIGYRGRELLPYMGQAAREKTWIAQEFKRQAAVAAPDLVLDIETKEFKRLYGKDWYRFLGNCKGSLGVEAGVSVFDLDGEVYDAYLELSAAFPEAGFDSMVERLGPVMARWEDRIFYRTISPRHFEAAAFGICQILFEGSYSGILEPWTHYLPLRKDFSNFDEIVARFKSTSARSEITKAAYRDLIDEGTYAYQRFIEGFDRVLIGHGLSPRGQQTAFALSPRAGMQRLSQSMLTIRARRPQALVARCRALAFGIVRRLYRWTQTSRFARRYVVPVIRPFMKPLIERYKRKKLERLNQQDV